MAIGVLILGEPGTGKSYSIKGFSPEEVKIISVTKPILPFRGKYEVVKVNPMKPGIAEQIEAELRNTDKKAIVIDDFQHVLGRQMMARIGEKGWDKFNEIQQPYAEVLNIIDSLPNDVIVYITSHTKTEENGRTHCQTIGKAMDQYMAIEGLFMIVLGATVNNDEYYFETQNNGHNTLKSPEGMFPERFIENNLKYVDEKIRNYYFMDGAKSDAEIREADEVIRKSDGTRKPRKSRKDEERDKLAEAVPEAPEGVEEVPFEEDAPASEVLSGDTCYKTSDGNYVRKHAGDAPLNDAEVITEEEFNQGVKAFAQQTAAITTVRRRRTRN